MSLTILLDTRSLLSWQLLGRRVFQQLCKVSLRQRVTQHPLLLRDEVSVGPVNLYGFYFFSPQEPLITAVEHRRQHCTAPTVQHRVMKADDELEALFRAQKDVN